MSPSRIFILRPVATSLMMAGVVLVGFVAFRQLPVSALPQVDYPTMQVQTFYPGAGPEVMTSAVTAPLEKQFGQVPGLTQMTSISSFGSSLITLQFSLDLSIDVAEQEVQAAINAAGTFLPANLPTPPIYSKTNPADAPILTLAITSKNHASSEGRRAGRNAHGAANFAAQGCRSGQHQRRTAPGRAGSGKPGRPRFLRAESGYPANALCRAPTSTRPRATSTAHRRPGRSTITISCSPEPLTPRSSSPTATALRCGYPMWLRSSTARRIIARKPG